MQQSALGAYISPQLSVPHLRCPMQSPLLSQSASPNSQGYTAVQSVVVIVVVVIGVVVIGVVVVVVDVAVVEIKDGSEIKQK